LETNNDGSISLNKFISSTGICSRREADTWISAGRVTINNLPTQLGNRVFPGDLVHIDGKPIKENPPLLYIAYHKPEGNTDFIAMDRLIKSMTHIRNANLIIAGNDEENYTKVITKLIEDNKLENRIIIWGGVNEKQRSYLMQNAKLFVLTSYSENFGNVILEALYERCPVALTEDVGLYEKIIKAQVGTHLSKTSKKIGEEINFALSLPKQLKKMSNKGYELVTNDFSWSSVAKQMDVAYQSIILSKK
jgi:glycosyltransferase involved in cell wall biosynthesis